MVLLDADMGTVRRKDIPGEGKGEGGKEREGNERLTRPGARCIELAENGD